MKKLLDIGPYFAHTYEPSIQLLELGGTHNSLEKRANEMSEAYSFASSMTPKEGHTYILVIAMGAGEYYGPNKNGDYFPEEDLKLQYKNFETKYKLNSATGKNEINEGALFYKHHKNKPHKGHPWFGTVHKAFYNENMHRVELIIDIHNEREGAQELVDKVHSGGSFSVSMGVNIPYDTCCVCKNRASKMEDYCDHLKYELNRIRPDGTRVYAINGQYDYKKKPKALNFFDISYVFRPADKTGYMLKKVAMDYGMDTTGSAEAFAKQASDQEKVAQLLKLSEITKYFEGQPIAVKDSDNHQLKVINRNPAIFENVVSQMQELSPEHLDKLSQYPMGDILATLSDLGIMITTPEFVQLVVKKKTGELIDLDTLRQVCKDQSQIFQELADNPDMIDELQEKMTMLKTGSFKEDIREIVEDIRESRDLSPAGFAKKASVSPLRSNLGWHERGNPWGDNLGMHHTESLTDPATGKKYVASMGSIDEARNQRRLEDLAKIAGGAALLGGAYHFLRSKKGIIGPAIGVGSLALGAKLLYDKFKKDKQQDFYTTDSGMQVPINTALYEKTSQEKEAFFRKKPTGMEAFAKKHGPAARSAATFGPGLAAMLGHKYYENRLKSGTAGTYRTELERNMDNLGRIAYEHPILSTAGGMAAGHLGLNVLKSARKMLGK
jgi:hypothetical protein